MARLTFLGTGAAEGYPNPFCTCVNGVAAREVGSDIGAASQRHRVPLTGVGTYLLSHAQADHFDSLNLVVGTRDYGVPDMPLALYASAATLRQVTIRFEADMTGWDLLDPAVARKLDLTLHPVEPYSAFDAGPYRATAYPTNHGHDGDALLFVVDSGDRTLYLWH